ncbi:MAG: hypothetical protein CMJ83_10430 [Planctomycetes bacterium]|nr:hypothetical protein [Planctomycetota bacterium]
MRWLLCLLIVTSVTAQSRIEVSFPEERSGKPFDGRVLVMFSTDFMVEPRFKVGDGQETAQVFGIDANGLRPGEPAVFDGSVLGYPIRSLTDVPPGEYFVQALLHEYETFRRSDGHTVKLPMDRGEGQHWNRAPGNLYSSPRRIKVDPGRKETLAITLDQVIPPIPAAKDTKYIKHVRIQSKLLTEFWGRPMHLGACVLLPEGFEEHPAARYPLIINHGHFPHTFSGFRESPPDRNLKADFSKRFGVAGYNRIQQQHAYDFYKKWTGPDHPRFVIIKVQHANPYYDDSYAVNSQNLGPYGDAIMKELVPHIEKQFRCIGAGWARFTYGGSTGGWEALAVQVFYPDDFNGAFIACPDPIDFRAYTVVNIYEDTNAYWQIGRFKRTPRPGRRDRRGHVSATLEQMNHRELVLGTKSRSGDQWDIWEAVYSPVGEDGYPKRIWDKTTGKIDQQVAEHWKQNYDLRYILERDWKTLGPKLKGKLRIYCGTKDNYYLDNAVRLMEAFLENTKEPYYDGVVDYGPEAEHCWNGDQTRPNHLSRLRYHQMYVETILDRIKRTAPKGADVTSWRY